VGQHPIPRVGITAMQAAAHRPRVLCVDDDPMVLDGLALVLRSHFEIFTAECAEVGLQCVERNGPFAVVISDMHIPLMGGAVFLAHLHQRAPDTVRVLLTGDTELEAAVAAINTGHIFRYLAKPCPAKQLLLAVEAAIEQYRLVTAERVLLEQTLRGSIRTLTDILALQNPLAFGRATRAKIHVAALASLLHLDERWPVEVAAMLCSIGTVTLPHETVEKLYDGRPLTLAEQAMVKRLPAVTEQLLANIPRLEPVREILAHLEIRFAGEAHGPAMGEALTDGRRRQVPIGARILQLVLDYDALESQGLPRSVALDTLRARPGAHDPDLLNEFGKMLGSQARHAIIEELQLAHLEPGMVLVQDIRTMTGMLLISRGYEVTASMIERIDNVARNSGVKQPVRVMVPPHLRRTRH
jgi:response regulator RpfG family c-di-GMP phosphodiesterase